MAGFIFEKDLEHQNAAVAAVMRVLDGVPIEKRKTGTQNPILNFSGMTVQLQSNILALKKAGDWAQEFKIETSNLDELIFDISMETGTGKTYAYTKAMLELNKQTGITKFIVAVPRVAIKAGTVNFLKSPAAKEHFRDEFERDIKVYEVQSQKSGKAKKEYMPQAINEFCRADSGMNDKAIHILVINSGMITSPTISKAFDVALFDEFNVPYKAIAHTKPVLIIDEPHTFKRGNTTYQKLMRFNPQFTLRYGATFDGDLNNLIYELTAVDAFNQDLVKGITVHSEKFEAGENIALRLIGLDSGEATFELNDNGTNKNYKLIKKDSFETIHNEMQGLFVDNVNQSKIVLSNGLELKKSDRINPYSYAETLQEKMLQNAIVAHFKTERQLMTQSPRIKPLSLFFIDNIESYRDDDGALRTMFEGLLKSHIQALLNSESDTVYKQHLETALRDVSALHGGYFSKDNSEKDDKIEKETIEILHEKETLLDIDNPRRFIFSKWTLREGWDNPNVFVICKLRSSGSETSKLQEVGRGLRLPVNEFMARDKSAKHELHYFVDFTEKDFTDKLTQEINKNSKVNYSREKLDGALKEALLREYIEFDNDEDTLLEKLIELKVISISQKYKDGGYEALQDQYPNAFAGGVKTGKVKEAGKQKSKATIRTGKYSELKQLWEKINEKVALEYKVKDDKQFRGLFQDYLSKAKNDFSEDGSISTRQKLTIENEVILFAEEQTINQNILPMVMMDYRSFLRKTSEAVQLSVNTVHEVYLALSKQGFDISKYMSLATIRKFKAGFNDYLMQHAFGKFEIGFKQVNNNIHPTKFTDSNGKILNEINSGDVGIMRDDGSAPDNYFFDEIFYDGQLELENISTKIDEVIIYSKIPKNSIRIPLVGGGTYSPDFAYVIKGNDGKSKLNFVIETKDKDEVDLGKREDQKIKHAQEYFNKQDGETKVIFKRQLKNDKILDLIKASM